jgi:hypothetical protein
VLATPPLAWMFSPVGGLLDWFLGLVSGRIWVLGTGGTGFGFLTGLLGALGDWCRAVYGLALAPLEDLSIGGYEKPYTSLHHLRGGLVGFLAVLPRSLACY